MQLRLKMKTDNKTNIPSPPKKTEQNNTPKAKTNN